MTKILLFITLLLLCATRAWAQDPETAARYYKEAKKAYDKKDYTNALQYINLAEQKALLQR